ncbi:MAG: NADH-quinone oxidoreductase subunit J [Candidatus Kapaibacterium sp.]
MKLFPKVLGILVVLAAVGGFIAMDIPLYDKIFYIFAAICVGSGAFVVFSRNIAYSAFSLLFAFFGVAGIYVLLGADFVGVSQLLIYVGGILVLFLFGMMLTANIDKLREERPTMGRLLPGVVVSSAICALLISVVWGVPAWRKAAVQVPTKGTNTTSLIGNLLMGDYALLFVASSIAILVALVGAAMIARSDRFSPEDAAERM